MTPEVFLRGWIVLNDASNHRKRRRLHHILRFGVSNRGTCWTCEIVEAAAVEVVVVRAVHIGRLTQTLGALEDVETVADVGVGAAADIAICRSVHQHEWHAVRIRACASKEVGRRNRNQQANVIDLIVRRGKCAVEESVVATGDAFAAARVADPHDCVAIHTTIENTAANRCELCEETFRVFKRRRGRRLDARHRVVLMAHHDVAPTCEVIAEVVVPRVVVAVSVRNHDERTRIERCNRRRVIDPLEFHRVEDVRVVDVVRRDLRNRKRPRSGEIDDVPEAWFITRAVDEVAIAEYAVTVRIHDEVESAARAECVAGRNASHRQ